MLQWEEMMVGKGFFRNFGFSQNTGWALTWRSNGWFCCPPNFRQLCPLMLSAHTRLKALGGERQGRVSQALSCLPLPAAAAASWFFSSPELELIWDG